MLTFSRIARVFRWILGNTLHFHFHFNHSFIYSFIMYVSNYLIRIFNDVTHRSWKTWNQICFGGRGHLDFQHQNFGNHFRRELREILHICAFARSTTNERAHHVIIKWYEKKTIFCYFESSNTIIDVVNLMWSQLKMCHNRSDICACTHKMKRNYHCWSHAGGASPSYWYVLRRVSLPLMYHNEWLCHCLVRLKLRHTTFKSKKTKITNTNRHNSTESNAMQKKRNLSVAIRNSHGFSLSHTRTAHTQH